MIRAVRERENIIFCALFTYLAATSFINQDVYAFTVRFASVVIFVVLGVLALPYLAEHIRDRDPDLYMLLLLPVLTLSFALMSGSGLGAVFIPTDLALICYVTKYLRLTRRAVLYLAFVGACPVSLWYSHVRWSYNFNMVGFAFMLMAFFAMILVDVMELRYKRQLEFLVYITAFILSVLYHTRTAISGIIAFGIFFLMRRLIVRSRRVCTAVIMLSTLGSVLFTLMYTILSEYMYNAVVLNKHIFSGREDIWTELWLVFAASPVTGTGSGYVMKSFEIFEVHNGMFDILVVHGVIVFIIILTMLVRMLLRLCGSLRAEAEEHIGFISMCAVFAMLISSFTENFFITPPYSLFFMTFAEIASFNKKEIFDEA